MAGAGSAARRAHGVKWKMENTELGTLTENSVQKADSHLLVEMIKACECENH